jgi:hypothetical protein
MSLSERVLHERNAIFVGKVSYKIYLTPRGDRNPTKSHSRAPAVFIHVVNKERYI